MASDLPPIPAKRYFTIGEVGDLCDVKPYVLRYWEREFTQLRPTKRRGNRRYYQHHEVLMIRRIRDLLHVQGLSIEDARRQLQGGLRLGATEARHPAEPQHRAATGLLKAGDWAALAQELRAIRALLNPDLDSGEAAPSIIPNSGSGV